MNAQAPLNKARGANTRGDTHTPPGKGASRFPLASFRRDGTNLVPSTRLRGHAAHFVTCVCFAF